MYIEKYLDNVPMNSGWSSEEEFVGSGCRVERWSERPQEGGLVLYSKGDKVIVDGGDGCRHALINAPTGAGKTFALFIPSLIFTLKALVRYTLVIFDVKGELEMATIGLARAHNDSIVRIDFRDPARSDRWNPFAKANKLYVVGSQEEAWKELEKIIAIIFDDGGARTDAFWRNACASLFRGICAVIWAAGKELTVSLIVALGESIPADKEGDRECELFRMADMMPKNSIARNALQSVRNCTEGTRGNIMASYRAYLSFLTSRTDVMKMISCSSEESIDFKSIGIKATVLYISLPDDSAALGALQGLLLTQLQQELNQCAIEHGGKLPVRTEIYIDELANIQPAIPALAQSLTIARSRRIRYVLAIQSYSQLQSVYRNGMAETIAANSTWVALYISKDEEFRERVSKLCGRNQLGNCLIAPSELALIPYGHAVILKERSKPFYTTLPSVQDTLRLIEGAAVSS